MIVAIFILFILIAIGAGGVYGYFYIRKTRREQKNYERGLKMVPLLIHIPPLSDDAEKGGRDARDLADENISKAQTLYGILASTYDKKFKSKYYGQKHIALEIVAHKGFVYFYAAVPVPMIQVFQQALVSAYPSSRLEEVADHNIFSPVGRINATTGGEMVLKENFAYPIATYQDVKRDSIQSVLNALSTLDKEDGAGIQFLLRPASPEWRKKAHSVAENKRKGKKKTKGIDAAFSGAGQVFTALTKPPENKGGGDSKPSEKPLSSLDQSIVDAIDDKTRQPGFEITIRIIASSNVSSRAVTILNNLVATFALYDAPGKNGFKYAAAKDLDHFITSYNLRIFQPENNKNILNSTELATLFHFPDQSNIPTSQLERQASKQVDGPRNIGDEGLLLGYNVFRGIKKPIRLSDDDRRRHMYVVGQTGTGKSVFLENMALQDMLSGRGFAFVDPHGDTAEKILEMVPKERTEDVIYFCPADMDYPLGLNMFEFSDNSQKDFLIQEAIDMLYKLYDPQHQGIIGPRYEAWFRNAALTIMADPEGATFIDIPNVFQDNKYMKNKLQYVKDPTVLDFWNKEMAQTSDYHKSEVLGWFVSKFGAFRSNEMMRNIIGQNKSAFDMRKIMDEGKILLVNLSKGRTGELNSKLLGMIFVMKFQAAAMSRANVLEEDRKDFCLYVDEFQNFSTDSFASILSEARKYRLNLIVANQFTTQLSDEIRDAVFGNVGTMISFRVGTADAEALVKKFQPVFDTDDLQRIPNHNTVTQMIIGGVPSQAFSMVTLPPLGNPNRQLGLALKQLSAAKHGRPKAVVEEEIFARMRSADGSGNTPSNPPGVATAAAPVAGAAPKPASSNSFLDDWLNKRKQQPAPPPQPISAAQPIGNSQPAPQQPIAQSAPPIAQPTITTPSAATSFGQPMQSSVPPVIDQPQNQAPPAVSAPQQPVQTLSPAQLTPYQPTASVPAQAPHLTPYPPSPSPLVRQEPEQKPHSAPPVTAASYVQPFAAAGTPEEATPHAVLTTSPGDTSVASAPAPDVSNQTAPEELVKNEPSQPVPKPQGEWSASLRAGDDHEHEVDLKAVASSSSAQADIGIEIDTSGNIHQKETP